MAKEKVCELCGKTYQQRWSNQKYCSTDCKHKADKRGSERMCPVCGKVFYKCKYFIDRGERIYCSKQCELSTTEYIDKNCSVCGKTFRVKKAIQDRYKVCSLACRYAHKKVRIQICEVCGKEYKAREEIRRHCSVACYRRSSGETGIERKVRTALESIGVFYQQEARIGRYAVDFLIPVFQTVIEADGKYWHRNTKERDQRKDDFVRSQGFKVLRLEEQFIDQAENLAEYLRKHI